MYLSPLGENQKWGFLGVRKVLIVVVVDVYLLVKADQLRPRTRLSTFGVISRFGLSRGHTGTPADDSYAVGVSGIFILVIFDVSLTNGWGENSQPRSGVDCTQLVKFSVLVSCVVLVSAGIY